MPRAQEEASGEVREDAPVAELEGAADFRRGFVLFFRQCPGFFNVHPFRQLRAGRGACNRLPVALRVHGLEKRELTGRGDDFSDGSGRFRRLFGFLGEGLAEDEIGSLCRLRGRDDGEL